MSQQPHHPQLHVVAAGDHDRAEATAEPGHEAAPGGRGAAASTCVGIIVADATTGLFSDPYFLSLFTGISAALAERSLLLMLMAPMSASGLEATLSLLARREVCGSVLVGLHRDSPLPAMVQKLEIPAVTVGHTVRELSNVECDNREGATQAVDHLLSLGRRRIAVISGTLAIPVAVDRLMGYRDALTEAGLPIDPSLEEAANFLPDLARLSMRRLLTNHPDLDAVFVASDQMATAVVEVLTQAGRRIPEDVAVIGFDDSRFALQTTPPLSSIRQDFEELGYESVHVLMRHIAEPHEAPRQVRLKTKLIVRASTVGADQSDVASAVRAQ
jgi:DNA-binding LacI/PurR family transcriptional regulator